MTNDGRRSSGSESHSAPALGDTRLPVDALLDILANANRRYLLDFLREQPDQTASFEAVAKHFDTEAGRGRGVEWNRDEVQAELYHHHLPKLADAGVVDYDVRSQTIRYHPNERLEELFDYIQELREA